MTEQIHDITRGLEFTPFKSVQEYIAEHIDYGGRNLFLAKRYWKLLDPKYVEDVRRFYNDDAGFPEFLEDLKHQDIRKMETALHEGLQAWGHDGRMIVFAQERDAKKFQLLPKSLWVFAEIDLETAAISLDGEACYDAPRFLLAEHIPEDHAIFAFISKTNDPAEAGLSDTAEESHPNKDSPSGLPTMKSGMPGRPSSKHLILGEFERRQEAGQLANSLKKEAGALTAWLEETHPEAPPSKIKSTENAIREAFRVAKSTTRSEDSKPAPK